MRTPACSSGRAPAQGQVHLVNASTPAFQLARSEGTSARIAAAPRERSGAGCEWRRPHRRRLRGVSWIERVGEEHVSSTAPRNVTPAREQMQCRLPIVRLFWGRASSSRARNSPVSGRRKAVAGSAQTPTLKLSACSFRRLRYIEQRHRLLPFVIRLFRPVVWCRARSKAAQSARA